MMVEFINKDLDHHILKAIKLLFGANKTNQIHYQINSKGFTDSTVISVQPFSNFENPQKYIIKIGDRNNTKLLNEEEKFRKHVETTDSSYSIEVQKTEKCFAIRYHYATSDSEIESKSFGGILRSSKNDYPISKRKSYIKKLFKTPTYKRWDSTELDDININYKNYRDFINFDAIKNHLNKIYDSSDVDQLEVVDIFKKAKKIKLEGNTQICHGDLHTENFFIDENENAYLIDFGDVGRHHNIIDYAMLETSIKLNHTPNYIPNDKLYKLEKELLNDNTFNSNYSFKSTQRQDLVNVYSLITTIRELAADKINNPNEYFYSLFMLTFRQIRYDDLNQLYAIEISEQIGRKLLKELC
ncbi:MAG: phosphotransferase [Balneolaceae bacterium]|nr:phosphotransferase [Balneolaceae bacterium]